MTVSSKKNNQNRKTIQRGGMANQLTNSESEILLAGLKKVAELSGTNLGTIMKLSYRCFPGVKSLIFTVPGFTELIGFTLEKPGEQGGLCCSSNPDIPGEVFLLLLDDVAFKEIVDVARSLFDIDASVWAA